MRFDDVVAAIGHTPLVRLRVPGPADLYGKLEMQNTYAMKDRVARELLTRARASGALRPGAPVIESSSGSMALGLALVGRALGHPVHIVTDPRIDPLTSAKLTALGCVVDVVPRMGDQGWQSARLDRLAELRATLPDAFWPGQYTNPDNPQAYAGLAAELRADLGRVDVLVGAVGSGGSLCGSARAVRAGQDEPLRVVAVDSVGSVLFDQPDVPGRLQSGLGNSLHPANLDRAVVDEVHWLNDREAFEATCALAAEQQLFAGNTAGSVYRVARYLAGTSPAGTRIVAVLPDRGDRYVETVYDAGYRVARGIDELPCAAEPADVRHGTTVHSWSRVTIRPAGGPRRLVFVESNTTGSGMTALRRSRELGLHPVLLTADPDRYSGLAATGAEVVHADTSDPVAVAAAAHGGGPVAGITTTSDFFVLGAARLARAQGLAANPPGAVARCRDKARTRRALTDAGLAQPRYAEIRRPEDLPAAIAATGLPCVVKPAAGSGSEGVRLCTDRATAEAHARQLLALDRNARGQRVRPRVLVEQVLTGPEVSVETIGADGEVHCVGVTATRFGPPPFFVETGHVFPAGLPAATVAALADLTGRALKTLGLVHGPAHTEVRLTPAGPVVVEVNPRLAGGMIPELVRRASGVDLLAQQLVLATGGVPDLVPTLSRHAGIRFLTAPRTGRLTGVDGLDEARRVPGVVHAEVTAAPGTPVGPARDAYGRIGHLIAVADDRAAVDRALDEAAAAVRLTVAGAAAATGPEERR